jgi:hypothetical protein
MKMRLFTICCILMSAMLCSTQLFARQVYVKLASDAAAWSHVTQDADNVIMTLPEGSTDFVANILTNLLKGDEVWVAKGIYTNTGKLALVDDSNNGLAYGGIKLYGGFAGAETALSERALSDKDENGLVEAWEFTNETNFRGFGNSSDKASGFQLIQLGQGSVLDGVTISDNYFTGANQASGGIVATTATIQNCIIRDLTTEGTNTINGGGLYVAGGKVESCLFEKCASIANETSAIGCYGGGLLIFGIADNTAGTPTGSIRNSVIRNCRAGQGTNNGRGAGLFGKGGAIVENCVIYNNTSTQHSAGFYFHNNGDANSHVNRIIGCTIANNCGLYSSFPECDFAEMYNIVSWGNSSVDYPLLDGTSYNNAIRLRNTTNAQATAYPFLDGIAFNGTIQNPANNKNASFSGFKLGGAFNDPAEAPDPKFKNPTVFQGAGYGPDDDMDIRKANWTLQDGSPLINTGVDAPTNRVSGYDIASLAASFSGVDNLGRTRNVGKFDIGAYEFGASGSGISKTDKPSLILFSEAGILTIKGLQELSVISVYNLNGTLISSVKVNSTIATIPVAGKGVYIINVKSNNQVYNQKVIL